MISWIFDDPSKYKKVGGKTFQTLSGKLRLRKKRKERVLDLTMRRLPLYNKTTSSVQNIAT